jgi:hypothetical protein
MLTAVNRREPMYSTVTPMSGASPENLARAYRKAVAERLIAFPETRRRWACRRYTIEVTGPNPLDVECDCPDAVYRERICKHAAFVVFCRLYGLVPCPPAASSGIAALPDCVDDFVARLRHSPEIAAA